METPEKQEELQTETSFDSVKESASDVLGGLMGQIKRLEEAMKEERMAMFTRSIGMNCQLQFNNPVTQIMKSIIF